MTHYTEKTRTSGEIALILTPVYGGGVVKGARVKQFIFFALVF